ncbi:abortive infection family protein [Azospirillum soli]|uniref:abortive infection family protein n=1 Tax=Azospirillum soli TaxID=1304799 RepID=UPI001AEABDDB|nr:abortive infection family protein [Azospirillum soli]MBP2315469.1 hypothetical protein [Azospirillum soli]
MERRASSSLQTNRPALSPRAVEAIVEIITGGAGHDPNPTVGIYRSATQLERFFRRCNLNFSLNGASRVPAVEAYLLSLMHDSAGQDTLVQVLEMAVDPRDFAGCPERLSASVEFLNMHLRFDGLELAAHGHRFRLVRQGQFAAVAGALAERAVALDLDTVHRDTERALQQAHSDPEDAVTAACSMLESVCRSILKGLGKHLPAKKDLAHLMGAVQAELNLSPSRKDLPTEIEDDVRRILGGLTTVTIGIGALRTHAGDAHGRERGFRRIDARIACLAVHSASTIAIFLIETWQSQAASKPVACPEPS